MFSIIIPHKNEPVLLQRCLDSIPLTEDIEVIVIDDNSNAELVNFDQFPGLGRKNTEIILLKEEQSKGAGHARNIGLEKATGDWLLFCDADDYFTAVFYETISSYKHCNYDLIIFNIDIPEGIKYQGSTYQTLVNSYEEYMPETLIDLKYKVWAPWAKLYNVDFIKKIGLKFESRNVGNDCFFVISANAAAKKINVDKTKIYHHYYNNNGLSHQKNQNYKLFLERLEVNIWRLNFYKKMGLQHYLDGAGIYTYLIQAYQFYNFRVFIKSLKIAINTNADFIYPLKFKTLKICKQVFKR